MDRKLDFPLLKNGLDFIYSTVKGLSGSPRESDIKYAILHLCTGVELLFKERLRREHWTLVVDKIDNVDCDKYETGDFNSADFFSCIKRLEKICGIVFLGIEREYLGRLRAKRNKIEHFGLTESRDAAIVDVIDGVIFVTNFIQREIGEVSLKNDEKYILGQIRRKLGEFEAYVSTRLDMINPELVANSDRIVECPVCKQKALVLEAAPHCLFCDSSPRPFLVGGYIENINSAFWVAAKDEKIVPYIRQILEDPENDKKCIAVFPSNAIWALAQIGNEEALNVLQDYRTRSDHGWIEHAIKGILLRKEKRSRDFAILISDKKLRSEASYAATTINNLLEGEEIQILERKILNYDELGPRGGASVFDKIKHIASGSIGYIQRAGDNFPSSL